ncbi:MAG: phenylalanine--tRNA ligase beta subunit-related protein [Alphaproteobacteria bacterium]|nr:phenylalanine--tRNA ligase beta subunit-related protein [Alphaproteobacteria bacterium]
MKLAINPEIFAKYAPIRIGVLVLENINNSSDVGAFFDAEYAALEEGIAAKFEGVELASYPVVRRWREIYKSFGEKDARSSIEALIKRVKNGKGLYRVNPLVDVYNLASLKFEMPAGGENVAAIGGDMELTFADGSEKFLPIGATDTETPNVGEVVYKFGSTIVCRNFNYRESDITKLTADTTRAIIVFEDALVEDGRLSEALAYMGEKAAELLGAKVVRSAVLSADANEVEI